MIDLVAAAGALLLAATPGEGQVEVTAPDGSLPVWTIEAYRAPLSDMVVQLRETGITVTGAPADPHNLVSGEFSGELPAILSRILRNEDFILSRNADGYEIRFLSGLEGQAGSALEPRSANDPAPVRTADASRPGSQTEDTVADLLDIRLHQAAAVAAGTSYTYTARLASGSGDTAPGDQSGSSHPEQIAAMNAQAAEQLAGLAAGLRAACPAGRSCD